MDYEFLMKILNLEFTDEQLDFLKENCPDLNSKLSIRNMMAKEMIIEKLKPLIEKVDKDYNAKYILYAENVKDTHKYLGLIDFDRYLCYFYEDKFDKNVLTFDTIADARQTLDIFIKLGYLEDKPLSVMKLK